MWHDQKFDVGFEAWLDEHEEELRAEWEARDMKNPDFDTWVWEKWQEIGPDTKRD